ncbi:hypothetical protein QTP70_002260 [Hemibagrus guttatus]|uniref:Ig-like domain-containing protein n=1 Tax=Hemibagrus guttatus TaxID=175788 RepID=A0AAE0R6R0_9TELE|nr:hypothetical protein QTP70_002260 [Hemibagrus guttatus]
MKASPGSPKAVVSITPDTHVFIGERVTLRCDIQGGRDTQWTYSWKINNNELTESRGRVYRDSTRQEFRIWSVKDSDSGTYTCRGHKSDSQSSEISDAVTLTVSAKPKPTVRVNPQSSVYTGDTVTLSCELQQGTGWVFLWYKNNQLLQNSEQENTLNVTEDNAGETEYQCRVIRINNHYYFYYYTEFSDPVKITVRDSSYTDCISGILYHSSSRISSSCFREVGAVTARRRRRKKPDPFAEPAKERE